MKRFAIAVLAAASLFGAESGDKIMKEVRHELVTLSRYSVFDNLAYRVDGNKVTLFGQVTQPILKQDAERSVKNIEGVTAVDNQIEVLPLSQNDDQLRTALYRAIYSVAGFQKYTIQAVPPVHIIVKNGNVTLVGVVATQMDKTLAETSANTVPGVFSVKNELVVEGQPRG